MFDVLPSMLLCKVESFVAIALPICVRILAMVYSLFVNRLFEKEGLGQPFEDSITMLRSERALNRL